MLCTCPVAQVDASKRLGALKNGARDIMNHYFFNGIDWETMLEKVRAISRYRLPVAVMPLRLLAQSPVVVVMNNLLDQIRSMGILLLSLLRLSVPR